MQAISTSSAGPPPQSFLPQQIVTFKVGDQTFGVSVDIVREIKGWQPATTLPGAAPHVLGVINLRGQVIAVYDLAMRLGRGPSARGRASVVIVVDHGARQIGILADSVSDILDLSAEDMRRPPVGDDADPLIDTLVVRNDGVVPLLRIPTIACE